MLKRFVNDPKEDFEPSFKNLSFPYETIVDKIRRGIIIEVKDLDKQDTEFYDELVRQYRTKKADNNVTESTN